MGSSNGAHSGVQASLFIREFKIRGPSPRWLQRRALLPGRQMRVRIQIIQASRMSTISGNENENDSCLPAIDSEMGITIPEDVLLHGTCVTLKIHIHGVLWDFPSSCQNRESISSALCLPYRTLGMGSLVYLLRFE